MKGLETWRKSNCSYIFIFFWQEGKDKCALGSWILDSGSRILDSGGSCVRTTVREDPIPYGLPPSDDQNSDYVLQTWSKNTPKAYHHFIFYFRQVTDF